MPDASPRMRGAGRMRWPVVLLFLQAAYFMPAVAQVTAERIHSYRVTILIEPAGSVLISERIDYDFGSAQRHGIFRDVPARTYYDEKLDRLYPIEILSVKGSPGTPAQYEVEDHSGIWRIRIGDPDRTISGRHVYTLAYRVEGVLNGFAQHDELYWNAIGAEWEVPILSATVLVSGPGPFTEIACFSGPVRSSLPCPRAESGGAEAVFASAKMAPFHGLTVVVGLPKGSVPQPKPILDERWSLAQAFEVTPFTLGGSLALMAAALLAIGGLVWKSGRDRRMPSGIEASLAGGAGDEQPAPLLGNEPPPVEHQPPDGLRPGQVGTLVDEVANPLDATATIVDLAVRRYLKIEEIPQEGWFGKGDWELTKLENGQDDLRPYERLLLESLFKDGDEVALSDLRNDFAERLKRVEDALYEDAVAQGWFSVRPDRIRRRWLITGITALVLSAGVLAALVAFTHWALLGVPPVAASLLLLALVPRMPHRTGKGSAALRRVLGFRRFIEEPQQAESARFAEDMNVFSEYLPYAIVFGATRKWARAFSGLERRQAQTYWYVSDRPYTTSSFCNSMGDFAVTTSGTIASAPSGSGGSGFSGGSSGGGGGGGGGGSW